MKMKIALGLSLIVLFLCIAFVDASETQNLSLTDVFLPMECDRACWIGIQPNLTSKNDALNLLRSNGLTPREITPEDVLFDLKADSPLLGGVFDYGALRFQYDMVSQIELPISISLEKVRVSLGLPDRIIDLDNDSFRIVYASEGVVFETLNSHPDQIFKIYITNNRWLELEYVAHPNFSSLVTDCSQAPFLCDLLPHADAELLRDMLLSPNCTQACFYGIQPEITTRQEFEAFLGQHQVTPYIISPEDLDNTHYEWDLPGQTAFKPQNGPRGEVIFKQGKIVRLTVPLEIPLSTVYEVFGYPDTITNYNDRFMTMIYKKLGIAIRVSTRSQTRAFDVLLASADSQYETYLMSPPGEPVDQPCITYGTFPCIVPTATPMPK